MKVIIGCEYSGRIREAFRKRGHDAWSCDLLESEDGSPYHIQDDILEVLKKTRGKWGLGIFHPPCTRLCNSGVRWLAERDLWEDMRKGAEFFLELLNADIPRVAVENPIPHGYAMDIIKTPYTQIIQPHWFGEPESKATCLWLRNLPRLRRTHVPGGDLFHLPAPEIINQSVHNAPPGPWRWKERSRTFQSVADAKAEQWGKHP